MEKKNLKVKTTTTTSTTTTTTNNKKNNNNNNKIEKVNNCYSKPFAQNQLWKEKIHKEEIFGKIKHK